MRITSRRLNDIVNSAWHNNSKQLRKWAYNPAFMHPQDLAAMGAQLGDVLEISSPHGTILGIAQPAEDIKMGCVSISHCWGRSPDQSEDPATDGCNTNRLIANDRNYDPYTGIPLMSAIPVRVSLRQQPAQ